MLRPFRNQGGFTLAEMLVAVAIISFVLAGLLLLQQQGQQAYLFGSNRVEVQQNSRVALELISRELRSAQSITTPQATNIVFTDMTGATIQYQLSGTNLNRTDPTNGTLTLIGGVQGLTLTYKTQAGSTTTNAADIRVIDISITAKTEETGLASYAPGNRAVTVDTTVRLRNLL